jgi:hypothetical protein
MVISCACSIYLVLVFSDCVLGGATRALTHTIVVELISSKQQRDHTAADSSNHVVLTGCVRAVLYAIMRTYRIILCSL